MQYSEPIEAKTKEKPSVPRQLTARELLEASYAEIRRAKREEHMQKINGFKSKMFYGKNNLKQYLTRCIDNRKTFQKLKYIVLEILFMMIFI